MIAQTPAPRRRLLTGALVLAATLLIAGPSAAQQRTPEKTPPITDPRGFITMVYTKLAADSGYAAPEDVFTPHLAALWADEERDTPKGEVGRLDFYFWVNGNNWEVSDVKVTAEPVEGNTGRQVVTAKFVSLHKPQEMHFYFQRVGHRWLIDDVRSALPDEWTLSILLKYGYDGPITPGAGFEPAKP